MKSRQAMFGALTILLSVVISLVLIELALRVYTHVALIYDVEMTRYATDIKQASPNPLIGHVNRPNSEARLMGVDVRINSDGFRDREYPVARHGGRRLIFLGDSLTFGWGVEKSRTFEEILEADLNRTAPTEVINFGAGNYNTEQEVNLFVAKGLKYRPDEVVAFYFINDAEPTPRKSHWDLLASSRTAIFLWSRVNTISARLGWKPSYVSYYKGLYADGQPGWIAERKAFLQLRDVCAKNGIRLRVVMLPEFHQLRNYPFAAEHLKVATFLRDNGITAMDLAPSFAHESNPRRLWVSLDDAHPNAVADALIARYALPFIADGGHAAGPVRSTTKRSVRTR